MYGENHALINEFPELKERIHELKVSDHHFSRLFDQYHAVDNEVHRIEQGQETPADEYVEELKKNRLHLKDELFSMLQRA